MKKVLFFPLLKMPSGHHQVADAIAGYIKNRNNRIECRKIDLLSAWNPIVENVITKTYLQWIHFSPKTYAWIYKQFAFSSGSQRSYKYYEILFYKKMKEIVESEKPDLIICTHGFPSYFLSKLKMDGKCSAPIINVYTDFFINDVWGIKGIDYHFVPDHCIKEKLVYKNELKEERIFVTGIPTDEVFETTTILPVRMHHSKEYNVLVSGGSGGLGKMSTLLQGTKNDSKINYFVLCGKNKKLFQKIKDMRIPYVQPLPYISSRQQMNELYCKTNAIITKTGGVTISEAMKKRIPIFIHSALPGQEEINLRYLKKQKLVFELNKHDSIEKQLTDVLENKTKMDHFHQSIEHYMNHFDMNSPEDIFQFIESVIQLNEESPTLSS
jgi:processive 1,2-diacylglycerol beta-glucosyltransferase